jgi:hypothetical protein
MHEINRIVIKKCITLQEIGPIRAIVWSNSVVLYNDGLIYSAKSLVLVIATCFVSMEHLQANS